MLYSKTNFLIGSPGEPPKKKQNKHEINRRNGQIVKNTFIPVVGIKKF